MAQVVKGRFTAKMDGPFVIFLIGMRINRPLAVGKWLPTARAMMPMLRELYSHPEKGFLGGEFFFYARGPALVQYWRSFEDLERFARDPEDPHMPAWQRFNREARKGGAVGIWHETYLVPSEQRHLHPRLLLVVELALKPRFSLIRARLCRMLDSDFGETPPTHSGG